MYYHLYHVLLFREFLDHLISYTSDCFRLWLNGPTAINMSVKLVPKSSPNGWVCPVISCEDSKIPKQRKSHVTEHIGPAQF